MSLKVFTASCNDRWGYGGFEEVDTIVTANTEEEALGLVLTAYPKLTDNWVVEEVQTERLEVQLISHRSS